MSQIRKEVAFKEATEFVRQQDNAIQFWAGRYVVVQAGLAIAESALYTWKSPATGIVLIVVTLLAMLSIILVFTITAIIVRECLWQDYYIKTVKRTEGERPFLLYQPDYRIPGANIATIFKKIQWVLIAGWLLFIVLVWLKYWYSLLAPVVMAVLGRFGL